MEKTYPTPVEHFKISLTITVYFIDTLNSINTNPKEDDNLTIYADGKLVINERPIN